MVIIFKSERGIRCPIQVFYVDPDLGAISSYLSEMVAKYFLSFLSTEKRLELDERGHLMTHREQFAWLPIDNLPWTSDGLPEHERKNLNAFIAQQQVSA